MKILLIASNRERLPWPVPPLGAGYIASSLKKAGFEVTFLDLIASKDPAFSVLAVLREYRPQLIGISIRNIDNIDVEKPVLYLDGIKKDIVTVIRRQTSSPIVIGGAAVGIMPAHILEFLKADYAICGDGEETLCELAHCLDRGLDVTPIPGLTYFADGAIRQNPAHRIENITELPFSQICDWVDWDWYRNNYASVPIQTKRGCALTCTYCAYNRIEGNRYRLRKPARIVDEIEEIVKTRHPRRIEFVDSVFNIPLEHALEICREIARRNIRTRFYSMSINPSGVTEELVSCMQQAGFTEFSCTPESGSEKMLRALGKNYTLKEVASAAQYLDAAKTPVIWYFMLGGPGEDEHTIRDTFRFIEDTISPAHLVFITCGIRILPGTALEKIARNNGQFGSHNVDFVRPVWFRPKKIDLAAMSYMIERAVITHPNWITLHDSFEDNALLTLGKKIYSAFNVDEPFWKNAIRRKRIYRLLGYNQYRLRKLDAMRKDSLV